MGRLGTFPARQGIAHSVLMACGSCFPPAQVLHRLLSSYPDVWRHLHPDSTGCYTVWEVGDKHACICTHIIVDDEPLLQRYTVWEVNDEVLHLYCCR